MKRFLSLIAFGILTSAALAGVAVGADYKTDDPIQKRVNEQLAQNRTWEQEAIRREQSLVSQGNNYYSQKNFAKATECFRAALAITYDQWSLRKLNVGGQESLQPASSRDRNTYKLNTGNTRIARERLANMDQAVATETQGQLKKRFDKLLADADAAIKANDPAKAYPLLRQIVTEAAQAPDPAAVKEFVTKAQAKQKTILDAVDKPLDEAENLLKDGKTSEAADKLEAFAKSSAALLAAIPELKTRYDHLANRDDLRKEGHEDAVQKRVTLGDQALQREDYLTAARQYRAAATLYPETDAARAAAEKLAQMQNDPKIAEGLKQQEVDALCKPIFTHAENMIRNKQYDEARADCARLMDQFAATSWADRAKALLETIPAEAAAPAPAP